MKYKFLNVQFQVFYVLYSTLFHLPPLRFHCVGGCWDRTQASCDFGFDCQGSARSHPHIRLQISSTFGQISSTLVQISSTFGQISSHSARYHPIKILATTVFQKISFCNDITYVNKYRNSKRKKQKKKTKALSFYRQN